MIVVGAGGHSKELLDVLIVNGETNLYFYDDISKSLLACVYGTFPIIKSEQDAGLCFEKDSRYVLGIGGTKVRMQLAEKMNRLGGNLTSVISNKASVSKYDVTLGDGVNIMQQVIIQPSVRVGQGTLINANTMIHHDSYIGRYCEIGPAVVVTGNCTIGDFSFIGAGAILKPGIKIGSAVIVGAGAVVIHDIPDNTTVVGIPAKSLQK